VSKLGIVASFFMPALNATTVGPPDCSTSIAGESLCDPGAECTTKADGGVECSCEANGLLEASGQRTSGRNCTACFFDAKAGFFNVISRKCELCLPGHFWSDPHLNPGPPCRPCKPGFFQPESGASECVSCRLIQDGDSYQNIAKATTCFQCPNGTRHRASSTRWESPEDCVCAFRLPLWAWVRAAAQL
jgi:hypothetical protein